MDDLFTPLQAALAGEYSIERDVSRGGMGIVSAPNARPAGA
jgi:hypothetical protein